MEFLRIVLIILLVYFGLRILFRLLGPYLLKYVARKAKERFGQMQGEYTTRESNEKTREQEGKTTIHHIPEDYKTSNKKVGEYIDYEEID